MPRFKNINFSKIGQNYDIFAKKKIAKSLSAGGSPPDPLPQAVRGVAPKLHPSEAGGFASSPHCRFLAMRQTKLTASIQKFISE